MSKFTKYLQYVLLFICAVAVVLFYVQNGSGAFKLENMDWIMNNTSMVDGMLWWTYALVFVAIALVLVLSIIGMVKNPKSLKRAGITLGLTIVVVGVSYLLASGDPVQAAIEKQPSELTLKLTDTGLMITYILVAVSILSIIAGSIIKAVRNR